MQFAGQVAALLLLDHEETARKGLHTLIILPNLICRLPALGDVKSDPTNENLRTLPIEDRELPHEGIVDTIFLGESFNRLHDLAPGHGEAIIFLELPGSVRVKDFLVSLAAQHALGLAEDSLAR